MMAYVKTPRETVATYERIDLDGMSVSDAAKFFADYADDDLDTKLAHVARGGDKIALYLVWSAPEPDAAMAIRHEYERHFFDGNRAKDRCEYLRLQAIFEEDIAAAPDVLGAGDDAAPCDQGCGL